MKKLSQAIYQKKHQLRRAKYNARHRKHYLEFKRSANSSLIGLSSSERRKKSDRLAIFKKYKHYEFIYAPFKFSLRSNTEEVVAFISEISYNYERRKSIFISLKNVVEIDYDAIVVLLATMVKIKADKVAINGDFPRNNECRSILLKSGFLNELYKEEIADKETYNFGTEDKIYTHAFKRVDSSIAKGIIRQASQTVWNADRRIPGVYRIFMEAMQNTNNHAVAGMPGEKHWWLSVNHDRTQQTVRFSFLDFGIGVFRSLDNKPFGNKFYDWVKILSGMARFKNNAELMKLILSGQFHSTVTGKHFRGKGLPGIAETFVKGQVKNLIIITNNVYVDLTKGEYRLLNFSFEGTFIYWEIDKTSENLPLSVV